jgi:hypothetical protein
MNSYQLVLPQVLIPQILKLYHESPLAGHIGIQQTIDNLSEQRYFSYSPEYLGFNFLPVLLGLSICTHNRN